MRMLASSSRTLADNIENITKSGIQIDDIVRDSITRDIRTILDTATDTGSESCMAKTNRKTRIPLKEAVDVKNSTSKNNKQKYLKKKKYHSKDLKSCELLRKENSGRREAVDDSLASLHWLTDISVDDILEGKLIQTPPSPTSSLASEDGVEKRFIRGDSRYETVGPISYRQNHNIKPPYSYAALIIMAMKSKVNGKMTLSEIYKWISDNFVFYRNAEPTWQNSIRHNLSLNKSFVKIPRRKGDPGKGGYWSIVPEFADKLLENSIRKRRTNVVERVVDYEVNEITKRHCMDFLKTQLITKVKEEINYETFDDDIKLFVDEMSLNEIHQPSPVEILADTEHCRMDHPYGKSPVVNYNISDEESIRAIATHLERTSNVDMCTDHHDTPDIPQDDIPNSHIPYNSLSNAIRTDCIWSAESMSKVTEELLEAQHLDSSEGAFLKKALSSSNLTSSSALSPSLPGYMDLDE